MVETKASYPIRPQNIYYTETHFEKLREYAEIRRYIRA